MIFSGVLCCECDVGRTGEEGLADPGGGGGRHFPDGHRGHLVHCQDGAAEEEEQDGSPPQVLLTCTKHLRAVPLNRFSQKTSKNLFSETL